MTVGELLAQGRADLEARKVPEAQANVEFIMASVLRAGRGELPLHSGRVLAENQERSFKHLVGQRCKRVPLAYLLGTQPFMGLEILVTKDALIPRPETEEVVAEAIRLLKPKAAQGLNLIEIGTGTGCIALALSKEFPQATVYATDISPDALKLALKNALANHQSRGIRFIKEDLFKPEASPQKWADMVISNPPYIPSAEIPKLQAEVLHEPFMALDGGRDGLDAIRAIIATAPRFLKPGGYIVLEIGSGQGVAVQGLLEKGGFAGVHVKKDLQGLDRIAVGKC